ncbi:Stress-associated endoplasmic reticulum protein 2 [Taenia solium]|eukprot:TsM_000862400 transcript=TsM_000862400 gene=TsM_000862400
MSAKQRMKVQNERAHSNITNRGNVPKSLKSNDDQSNLNAWVLGLIVFVVCAVFEIIQHIRMAF